ncbi:PP2C family protein-serine/threonine phosphatase [Streptomyces boninensis]|uniref:PP2C family protein-serine/threonine phosphatase n=1 Tax=Streptomyces boninensis TaxID=2039455 RepID=UPI003B2173E9
MGTVTAYVWLLLPYPVVLVAAVGYAIWASGRIAARERRLAAAVGVAQRAILRPGTFQLAGAAISTRYRPAGAHDVIGGDLYAFADTGAGLRLLIGDVRGKGMAAAAQSAAAIDCFRDCAHGHRELTGVVAEMEQRMAGNLASEDFVTAVLAEFAPGRLKLANCGHPPPLHLPAGGPPALLTPDEPATPFGLDPTPCVQQVKLAPGDRVLFYTDGLTEARDRRGTMLDLQSVAPACALPDLDDALDTVLSALGRHTARGRDSDDIALVLIEPEPVVAAAA